MPADPEHPPEGQSDARDWFASSYRAIYVIAALILVAVAVGVVIVSRKPAPIVTPTPTVMVTEIPTTARFTMLGGTVKVKPQAELEWRDATSETELRKGDLVRTGRDSAAEITFLDGTVVHVRPDSLITIEESSQNPRTNESRKAWRVSTGDVSYETRVSGAGSRTEITTDSIRLTHDGPATGAVRVGSNGESDVRLFRGVGQVQTTAGQKVALQSNQEVRVSSAGQAGVTIALPTPPQLVAPVNDANLVYPNPSVATTTLVWKEAPGAQTYRVVVDISPGFYRPMVDRLNSGTAVRLQGLDIGQYCWKVAAVDRNNAEGRFSDFSRFVVTRPAAPAVAGAAPPLAIRAFDVRANILQIRGQTAPGASVFVNDEALTVQADGTFNEFVTLEKPGQQEVKLRVVGPSGGVREETRSVVVAF